MKAVRTRTVVVLGRRPAVEWEQVRNGLSPESELVVMSLGYPVTAGQRRAFARAQDLASEFQASFDALLVTSVREALGSVGAEDDVLVAARGRELRQLHAAFAARAPRG